MEENGGEKMENNDVEVDASQPPDRFKLKSSLKESSGKCKSTCIIEDLFHGS